MQTALEKAINLILTGNAELVNILGVTARMSLASSIIALLIGAPIGIWLGACRFRGRLVVRSSSRIFPGTGGR